MSKRSVSLKAAANRCMLFMFPAWKAADRGWGHLGLLEGQGDLVSRLILGIHGLTIWVIGILTYLLSLPDPPSTSS